ncbi:hypothetical protein F511_04374 [Dorcoceras hygrometricum]|uniref:Uncharacterized protein n=1 Tax=Dorcoceras hygrometricum TaxID=472368 RepID=A0A2Z7BKP2_9LAMI|nr:hypothetical protein F511_04374 [Dorcoceras hygrometricum]
MESAAVHGGARLHSRVMDSISCRQTYLRSYRFSRKETLLERTLKCLAKIREMTTVGWKRGAESLRNWKLRRLVVATEVKDFSAAAFRAILRRLMSCTASIDKKNLTFKKVNSFRPYNRYISE